MRPLVRGATLLRGPRAEIVDLALCACPPSPDLPWIGGPHARAPHVDRILGGSFAGAVVDPCAHLDVDRLGAVLGAIRGGGHLLWLGATDAEVPAPMTRRCLRILAAAAARDPDVCIRTPATWRAPKIAAPPPDDDGAITLRGEQASVADAISARMLRPGPPVLLCADRGRGKSTTLGIAAARALAAAGAPEQILVTSARGVGAAELMARGHARCRALGVDPARLRHVPVDSLVGDVQEGPTASLPLLVDEAAALPVQTLDRLVAMRTRIAVATTLGGYEGTGQAFRLGFAARLATTHPERTLLTLTEAIRFRTGDALERLGARIMGQDETDTTGRSSPTSTDEDSNAGARAAGTRRARISTTITELPGSRLAEDETRLLGVFGLLRAAHYRTRPSDLQRMLDDPAMRIWCAGDPCAPQACALALDEGGLDDALAAAMVRGERRPKGHLGAGVLAERLGVELGARARSTRIVRIAAAPDRRRRGIATRLVEAIAVDARTRARSLLTSSFGAADELLAFWRAAGFETVRIGARRERSTGLHSAFVVRSLDAVGEDVLAAARGRS